MRRQLVLEHPPCEALWDKSIDSAEPSHLILCNKKGVDSLLADPLCGLLDATIEPKMDFRVDRR